VRRTYVGEANSARSDETKSNLRLKTTVLVVIGQSQWRAYVTWPRTRRPIRTQHLTAPTRLYRDFRTRDVIRGNPPWRHCRQYRGWLCVTFSRKCKRTVYSVY